MPLETATYLTDLVASNPAHTDGLSQADSHMRLLKSCIKATFPNFTSAALSATQAQIDAVAVTKQFTAQNGANGTPSLTFGSDTTAGFYKGARAGQTAISGTLRGNGAVPVGALIHFAGSPPGYVANGGAGGVYLECNGAVYQITDYPELAGYLGTLYGGNGTTTFAVPNLIGTGRFLRAWTYGLVSVAVYQSNQNQSHLHAAAADNQGSHSHNIGITDPGHQHGYTITNAIAFEGGNAGSAARISQVGAVTSVAGTGITAYADFQGLHSHNISIGAQGGNESRPEAMTCYICVKA